MQQGWLKKKNYLIEDQIQFEKEDLLNLVEKDFGKEVCETVLL